MTQAQASLDTTHRSGFAGRARAARIGAGVALLAMALVAYGAYGDSQASSSQRSAVPVLLIFVVVAAAIVYGLLAPLAQRSVVRQTPAARRWAISLAVASVLSLAIFWSGLPLILGGAAALVGYEGRSQSPGARAFGAAWWLGLGAGALAVIVTVVGNTLH
ncbi:MAG TPA: hypothetical protein VF178_10605 [Gemmatimonadaceae bacterium]|jgi:hypothetical protein